MPSGCGLTRTSSSFITIVEKRPPWTGRSGDGAPFFVSESDQDPDFSMVFEAVNKLRITVNTFASLVRIPTPKKPPLRKSTGEALSSAAGVGKDL